MNTLSSGTQDCHLRKQPEREDGWAGRWVLTRFHRIGVQTHRVLKGGEVGTHRIEYKLIEYLRMGDGYSQDWSTNS